MAIYGHPTPAIPRYTRGEAFSSRDTPSLVVPSVSELVNTSDHNLSVTGNHVNVMQEWERSYQRECIYLRSQIHYFRQGGFGLPELWGCKEIVTENWNTKRSKNMMLKNYPWQAKGCDLEGLPLTHCGQEGQWLKKTHLGLKGCHSRNKGKEMSAGENIALAFFSVRCFGKWNSTEKRHPMRLNMMQQIIEKRQIRTVKC